MSPLATSFIFVMFFITVGVIVNVVIDNPTRTSLIISALYLLPLNVPLSSAVVRAKVLDSLLDAPVVEVPRLPVAHAGLHHINDCPGVLVISQLVASKATTVSEYFAAVTTTWLGLSGPSARYLANLHLSSHTELVFYLTQLLSY